MALRCSAPASSNSVRAPQPAASSRCCRIVFHAGSPAERQLFRTDFRFAPSPRRASLAGPPIHEDMVVHGLCGRVPDSAGNVSSWIASIHRIAAAQTDANLSAHLHRLLTPPPYLCRMRLSPGRGAGIRWVIRLSPGRDAGVWCWICLLHAPAHRSCKSPRERILVLGTSGAHWPARWPRF